jgi:hypothetical protein
LELEMDVNMFASATAMAAGENKYSTRSQSHLSVKIGPLEHSHLVLFTLLLNANNKSQVRALSVDVDYF